LGEAAPALAGLASAASVLASAAPALRPPRRLSLSAWADEHFYLSAESAAEPGRWRTIPYQRGIMDAITDPAVEQVSVMKSARVGYTKILDAAVGYYVHQDPCPIMIVQPTVEDAEGFSKEEIAPMLRDCPVLAAIFPDAGPRDGQNTILHKKFPGGVLSVVGANSGRGFRRVSRKVIALDEVDGYPPSAGDEGDQIKLAIRRGEYYWDRKVIIGSTPLVAGGSRIEEEFLKGDQRRYHVPCPQCGEMDFFTFREQSDGAEPRGHYMKWHEGDPDGAFFVCRKNGCIIEHKDKRWMVERGEWRADAPFRGHASFHVWAAYSYSPNATWGHIAAEFLEAKKGGVEQLKTFVNTVLGETWHEKGEAPEWQRLYQRREQYARGTVPPGVLFLTAGVDVQKDRLVYEVVGWGEDRQSWSIDAGVIPGDPAKDETWNKADELLGSTYPAEDGSRYPIRMLGIDSGFETQAVYNWARSYSGIVMACKGSATAKTMVDAPKPVDVNYRGKRIARGCKVWAIGVDMVKVELYGWLGLEPPTKESGAPFPPGYCHFPEHGEDFFKQITAEHRVKHVRRGGFVSLEWAVIPGRENHQLDARVYARAATGPLRLDQIAAAARARSMLMTGSPPPPTPAPVGADVPPPTPQAPPPEAPTSPAPNRASSWLYGGRRR
jgi:phage terminase large subunit GpA-like protein